jgi:hypothetical protein
MENEHVLNFGQHLSHIKILVSKIFFLHPVATHGQFSSINNAKKDAFSCSSDVFGIDVV